MTIHRTSNQVQTDSMATGTPPSDRETRSPAADANQSMDVRINGEPRSIPAGLTISDLLTHLDVRSSRVAVEKNRTIVPKTAHDKTPVEPGDTIEIVSFIGGG